MANQLKTGERQVFTTPSSLANRMGVVKGQVGDGWAIAADSLSKTLDAFAKKQAVIEEESWKNDYKVKAFTTISKFARDNSLNPSEFMAKASSYIESSIQNAPEKFRSWAKGYSGMMAAQNFDTITSATIKKKQVDSVNQFNETAKIELDNINDLIYNTNPTTTDFDLHMYRREPEMAPNVYPDHTTLFGENVLPRLSELVASYTKLYNTLDASFINNMQTPEEYMRSLKVGLEQSRVISIAKETLDQGITLQDLGITGSKVKGWTSENAVDMAYGLVLESMEEYLINPDRNDDDGPFTLTATTNDEREKIKTAVTEWAKSYVDTYKGNKKTLSNLAQAEIKLKADFYSGYGVGSLNDARTTVSATDFASLFAEGGELWGALTEDITKVTNAYLEGKHTKDSIAENMDFHSTVTSVINKLENANIDVTEEKRKQIELNIMNKEISDIMIANNKNSDGIINTDDFRNTTFVTKDGNILLDMPSESLEAVIQLASDKGLVHPSLTGFLNGITTVNTGSVEDINRLYKIAQITEYIKTRTGSSVQIHSDPKIAGALEIFWFDMQHKPEDLDMTFFADKYLATVNKMGTDYDNKVIRIGNILKEKDVSFREILKGNYAAEHVYRFMTGSSKLETVPDNWKDAMFQLDNDTGLLFEQWVMEYLVSQFPDIADIVPSSFDEISKWKPKYWFKSGNEIGIKSVRAIEYALRRLGEMGYM